MPNISIKFIWQMSDSEQPYPAAHGALFHRWLPNDREDAIDVPTGTANARLQLWVERRGAVREHFVVPDHNKREVDTTILPTQAIVGVSHVFGLLELSNISKAELAAVVKGKQGDADYIALGKRAIELFIYPGLECFLNVFRLVYGQYWIKSLDPWDSRESL
jgi:hypothetical protein